MRRKEKKRKEKELDCVILKRDQFDLVDITHDLCTVLKLKFHLNKEKKKSITKTKKRW